jgi:NAD(P)-dependent dehydrogenase (short-subunit alcohol dehydrogenase family)
MRSVLITGTSKGIGYETALAFTRAGYRVHATMRNPLKSPMLAETAAKETLPFTVTAIDADDDDSVQAGIAGIQAQHGPVDALVNNAGVECMGSVEELFDRGFPGNDGDQLLWRVAVHQGRGAADARAPERDNHQHQLSGGNVLPPSGDAVLRIEMGARGAE